MEVAVTNGSACVQAIVYDHEWEQSASRLDYLAGIGAAFLCARADEPTVHRIA
ncbi:hypothetical protein [Microbacterium sp. Bi128]|uniref:hypothetical protein n=1 Tax=Microbacterium sp. Bi128 TaxID=2821115 RepID=UPI001DF8C18F|nr:hypothetical protein [Microbacterium sp. Bi128]CAH0281688.1 hypothetical protein SRABI128_03665 [Microbacterium sp. Bi128]